MLASDALCKRQSDFPRVLLGIQQLIHPLQIGVDNRVLRLWWFIVGSWRQVNHGSSANLT